MSWVRVNVLAEGQTEETFVRDVLEAHLGNRMTIRCRCIETSRSKRRRGGLLSYEQARRDIQRWLRQDQTAYVTTMFDLYALPTDFPGHADVRGLTDPYQRVARLEEAFAKDIGDQHFLPYIQLHEFEALLFSGVDKLHEGLEALLSSGSRLEALRAIREQCGGPERIDDGPTTAPSKRLLALFPDYDKVVCGSVSSSYIGLDTYRSECPHFHAWLSRLESLSGR